MKQVIKKTLFAALFAGLFFFVSDNSATKTAATVGSPDAVKDSLYISAPVSEKRLIYTCRLGTEEIPAVQISEISAPNRQATQTIARIEAGSKVEITAHETAPVWDYKSISAHSGDTKIEVAYRPNAGRKRFDWVLTLTDKDTHIKKLVRD